jgi:hypothetical protein
LKKAIFWFVVVVLLSLNLGIAYVSYRTLSKQSKSALRARLESIGLSHLVSSEPAGHCAFGIQDGKSPLGWQEVPDKKFTFSTPYKLSGTSSIVCKFAQSKKGFQLRPAMREEAVLAISREPDQPAIVNPISGNFVLLADQLEVSIRQSLLRAHISSTNAVFMAVEAGDETTKVVVERGDIALTYSVEADPKGDKPFKPLSVQITPGSSSARINGTELPAGKVGTILPAGLQLNAL